MFHVEEYKRDITMDKRVAGTCALACALASVYDNVHELDYGKKIMLYCIALGVSYYEMLRVK